MGVAATRARDWHRAVRKASPAAGKREAILRSRPRPSHSASAPRWPLRPRKTGKRRQLRSSRPNLWSHLPRSLAATLRSHQCPVPPPPVSARRALRAQACRTTQPFAAGPPFPRAPTPGQTRAGPWESVVVRFRRAAHRDRGHADRAQIRFLWDSLRDTLLAEKPEPAKRRNRPLSGTRLEKLALILASDHVLRFRRTSIRNDFRYG